MTAEVLRYAAFTEDGHGGNPAGVVLDAATLTDAQMLAIAAAIGYSETAFVLPGGVVRFFSPVAEVAFCGHATVAAAVALAERAGPGRLHLVTRAGEVAVDTRVEDGGLVAALTSPPTS
ncbi:PhzF family phenazine biosynthesis isomerase, partial [Actinoplanes sp. NPDC051633]|uniref:PhzF family phenazine biosynthesis isomerase n=1 Tax=Actinoplanes sp. NPDC051633 TaxID=3155670 RepID=UPI00342D8E2E